MKTWRTIFQVTNPKSLGLDTVQSAADRFDKWDPMKPTPAAKPAVTTAGRRRR